MGRHSAPDDVDTDVDLADDLAGDPVHGGGDAVLAGESDGRHSHAGGPRPRPSSDGDSPSNEGLSLIDDALEEQSDAPPAPMVIIDAETAEAVVLEPIDEPLAPDLHVVPPSEPAAPESSTTESSTTGSAATDALDHDAQDAPTTVIPSTDVARHDRPLPEETTARIGPVAEAPADHPHPHPHPHPAPSPAPASGPEPVTPAADADVEPATTESATTESATTESATTESATTESAMIRASPKSGAHATRHDLALVMRHGDVRARALAAVLVPFVVYVAVLAVIGELEVAKLVWIWIPAIAAGVLVGLVLDSGDRRYPAPIGEPARAEGAAAAPAPEPVSEPANPA